MKILEEIFIPQESVNDEDVVIVELFFKNGDSVNKGDNILEIETSKAIISIETHNDGFIEYFCKEGDRVNIGSIVSKIFDQPKLKEEKEIIKVKENSNNVTIDSMTPKTIFSKKARQFIEENNLNVEMFEGRDFVNVDDVTLFLNPDTIDKSTDGFPKKNIKKEIVNNKKNVHVERLSTQKLREIEYLSSVQHNGLNSSISVVVNFDNVIPFVNTYLSIIKGSFLPIITYELARLLRKFPKLNAYYENDSIVYYDNVNIGIAIDLEKGLKVLKIRDTDKASMVEIEESILSISKKYIENKSNPQDSSNITFTITDLSNEGVSSFLPLINKENSAILAISSLDQFNGMTFTITFDHRVTEGKYVASFLNKLKKRLESYSSTVESFNSEEKKQDIRCYKCHRKLGDENFTFLKVIDSNGNDQVLCHVCYEGY